MSQSNTGSRSGRRVLVVGAGAREHALSLGLARAGADVMVTPGNAGTPPLPAGEPKVRVDDIPGLVELAVRQNVDLVVVGPELPLTLGLVDALEARRVRAFGPSRLAAELEGSKAFMKRFLARHGVPTAGFQVFDNADLASKAVLESATLLVVKADGLAAGKGVVVPKSKDEALDAIDRFMREGELGAAGRTVVLEEFLPGEEASFHVVCDGKRAVALVAAQDHKRIFDGDRGPNTGGMGAYAPAPIVTGEVEARVMREVVEPTLRGMAAEGRPFKGVLFVGLMIENGVPRVLEFNVRFGDPETAVLVPLYSGDWFELLDGSARGDFGTLEVRASEGAALAVVMAAEGYPGKPTTGDTISGLKEPKQGEFVLHAGTTRGAKGEVLTAGGRVLTVGAVAKTLREAAEKAYAVVDSIQFRGEQHRKDIGHRALEPQNS